MNILLTLILLVLTIGCFGISFVLLRFKNKLISMVAFYTFIGLFLEYSLVTHLTGVLFA